MTGVMSFVLLF